MTIFPSFLFSSFGYKCGRDTDRRLVKSERMRLTERNIPSGTFKLRFFQDMFRDGPPGFLLAMRASYDADGYPSLPGGFKAVDYVVSVTNAVSR
jgi:hypothetical protein